jgi:colicin import membrane protein
MLDFVREHHWSVLFAVLLHGLLAAAFILMSQLSFTRAPQSIQPLPMDAVVVSSQVLQSAQKFQESQAAARAADEAQKAAAAEAAKALAAQQQQAADAKAAEAQQSEDARKAADAQKAADEQRAADAQKAAEQKQAEEAKKAADAKQAADAKRAAEERARADREAELRRQMAEEEHVDAVESGPKRDQYIASLQNAIQNAWIRPPSAHVGIDCMVQVTQVPGGAVTGAQVTQCNGDAAVRQSIENAVYRASPLPDPPDPALFQRNFAFRFKPND